VTIARVRIAVARLLALLRRRHAERDLDDELRAYLDERAAFHARRGLAPQAARRAARLEMEGVEQVKERVRDVRAGAMLEGVLRDLRYGARSLWRSPAYAVVVILTLTLGIGLNAAVFSVVHAVLVRPLPYPDADRLVLVEADTRALPSAISSAGPVFDVVEASPSIVGLSQVAGRDASIAIDGRMERVAGARATDGLLPLLGATPMALGRSLDTAQDARDYVVRGVVISHELWQRLFAGDPGVIGRRLTVNNFDAAIVGVLRHDFRAVLPEGARLEARVDVWMAQAYAPTLVYRGVPLVGRLPPGTTIAAAQAEIDARAAQFAARHPAAYPRGLRVTVQPLGAAVARDVKPALLTLSAAVGFVLLIACVNVANLLLARAKTREHELEVRRALGATRLRLIRQLLAENGVAAILGGAGGLLLAHLAVGLVEWLRPVHLPRQSEIAVDGVVVLWTVGLTLVAALLFALMPAVGFTRETGDRRLHASRAGALMLRSRRLHRGLVLAEIALSIVPLVGAGLMLRTFVNLLDAPLGFAPAQVVTARIPLDLGAYATVDRRSAFYQDAAARVRQVPGVVDAAVGGPLPLAPVQGTQQVWRSDDREATPAIAVQQSVMPGYFGVMGIPLRAGRDVSDDDIRHRRRVAVVDERLAARLWPGGAVGRRVSLGGSTQPLEVIGVAGAIRARAIRDAETTTLYVPSHVYEIEQTIVVRTHAPVGEAGPAIKRAVETLAPGRPVFHIRAMDEVVAASIDDARFLMLVLTGFAVASLALAGIGLHGTLAYLTAQRTREFGVRLALGASRAGILGMVVREGGLLAAAGAALGLVGAAALAQALRGLLYGVTPLDGLTGAGVAALLVVVAVVAVGGPAWRAARVDPTTALRAE
jgi:putative ABC transport system permease protein